MKMYLFKQEKFFVSNVKGIIYEIFFALLIYG